jgi:hypothetical protein
MKFTAASVTGKAIGQKADKLQKLDGKLFGMTLKGMQAAEENQAQTPAAVKRGILPSTTMKFSVNSTLLRAAGAPETGLKADTTVNNGTAKTAEQPKTKKKEILAPTAAVVTVTAGHPAPAANVSGAAVKISESKPAANDVAAAVTLSDPGKTAAAQHQLSKAGVRAADQASARQTDQDFTSEIKASSTTVSKDKPQAGSGGKSGNDNGPAKDNSNNNNNSRAAAITHKQSAEGASRTEQSSLPELSKTETSRIVKEIVKAVKPAVEAAPDPNKEYTVVIKLSPPALGSLEVKTVYRENGEMNISITASNPDTAAAIEAKSHILKNELSGVFSGQESGLNVNISTSDKSGGGEQNRRSEDAVYRQEDTFRPAMKAAATAGLQADKNSYLV